MKQGLTGHEVIIQGGAAGSHSGELRLCCLQLLPQLSQGLVLILQHPAYSVGSCIHSASSHLYLIPMCDMIQTNELERKLQRRVHESSIRDCPRPAAKWLEADVPAQRPWSNQPLPNSIQWKNNDQLQRMTEMLG